MEYDIARRQQNILAGSSENGTTERAYLDCLPLLVERAELAVNRLERFVTRFNGPVPQGDESVPNPPACHRTMLERLSGALHHIEEAANAIDRIG